MDLLIDCPWVETKKGGPQEQLLALQNQLSLIIKSVKQLDLSPVVPQEHSHDDQNIAGNITMNSGTHSASEYRMLGL
jgi:hypothetical protein